VSAEETPRTDGGTRIHRRNVLGAALGGAAALSCRTAQAQARSSSAATARRGWPTLVGSANAFKGMQLYYQDLVAGAQALDVALNVVKVAEADPDDHSVGLGGLPNEEGVVQLDAACMHGPTHNSGAVACIENILHPCEVARLVMQRTDHCLMVGEGAYRFARMHGHPHTELLTEDARRRWLKWKESMSDKDDRLPSPKPEGKGKDDESNAQVLPHDDEQAEERITGTIHCSALAVSGEIACTTTTSGLSWKIPGRVGDSPIVGAGLYCDQEAGSAGATGRGESAVLANGSFAIVELMRQGSTPVDAGLEVLRRVTRQAQRQAAWQPSIMGENGVPAFNLKFYILGLDGSWAGVALKGGGKFAVSDPERGPRKEEIVSLHE
jgi:N4-(beta-N-acetylglucosaminyl)-L-asparaginase